MMTESGAEFISVLINREPDRLSLWLPETVRGKFLILKEPQRTLKMIGNWA